MNKKFLFISLILIIFILPISVLAYHVIEIQKFQPRSDEEIRQEDLQEKKIITEKLKSKEFEKNTLKKDNNSININIEKTEQDIEADKKFEEILTRYYPQKFNDLMNTIQKHINEMPLSDLFDQPYYEEYFNMIIDIINNKDITSEEKDILIKCLDNQYPFIKESSPMKSKFKQILNNQ